MKLAFVFALLFLVRPAQAIGLQNGPFQLTPVIEPVGARGTWNRIAIGCWNAEANLLSQLIIERPQKQLHQISFQESQFELSIRTLDKSCGDYQMTGSTSILSQTSTLNILLTPVHRMASVINHCVVQGDEAGIHSQPVRLHFADKFLVLTESSPRTALICNKHSNAVPVTFWESPQIF